MQSSSQSYYITTALGERHLSKLKTIFNELLFYFRIPSGFLEHLVWVVRLKESWSNRSELKKYIPQPLTWLTATPCVVKQRAVVMGENPTVK